MRLVTRIIIRGRGDLGQPADVKARLYPFGFENKKHEHIECGVIARGLNYNTANCDEVPAAEQYR